jgi:hypothetical protein
LSGVPLRDQFFRALPGLSWSGELQRSAALMAEWSCSPHNNVPQRYLRNFQIASNPGTIWTFDKVTREDKPIPIKAVAQETDFYEPEIEVKLNEIVEKPAHPVIDKLLRAEIPTFAERELLALYIAVMIKRVPYRRERASSVLPQVTETITAEVREWLSALIGKPEYDQGLVQERLSQVDAIRDLYRRSPPVEVVRQVRAPWPTPEMIDIIRRMYWRVLRTSGPNFYITCDNPAFFLTTLGLKDPEAEVCLPVSSSCTLHCCWQPAPADTVFLDASQTFVKEVNRRLASTTFRFAFYHERAEWLSQILSKKSPYLSRIRW